MGGKLKTKNEKGFKGFFITMLAVILYVGSGFFDVPFNYCLGDDNGQDEAISKDVNDNKKDPLEEKLSSMTMIVGDKAFMKIYDSLDYEDRDFWNDLSILRAKGISDIDVFVNSYGGSAVVGFALCGLIKQAQKDGTRFHAIGNGIIASAALPVFLSFDDRTAVEHTIFMIHEPSSQMQGTSSEFRSQNALFDLMRDQYFDILMDRTILKDKEQWEAWERKTEWINLERAIEIGIVPIGSDK